MSYYSLGCEVHTTATYSKIAEAVDEETAQMLVDVLNAFQQCVQADGLTICQNCGSWLRAGECENCNSPIAPARR